MKPRPLVEDLPVFSFYNEFTGTVRRSLAARGMFTIFLTLPVYLVWFLAIGGNVDSY